jgi:catechol-2,3-dioxygenase
MKIDSAYIAVSDRKRAEAFWIKIFQIEDSEGNVVEFYSD